MEGDFDLLDGYEELEDDDGAKVRQGEYAQSPIRCRDTDTMQHWPMATLPKQMLLGYLCSLPMSCVII